MALDIRDYLVGDNTHAEETFNAIREGLWPFRVGADLELRGNGFDNKTRTLTVTVPAIPELRFDFDISYLDFAAYPADSYEMMNQRLFEFFRNMRTEPEVNVVLGEN